MDHPRQDDSCTKCGDISGASDHLECPVLCVEHDLMHVPDEGCPDCYEANLCKGGCGELPEECICEVEGDGAA